MRPAAAYLGWILLHSAGFVLLLSGPLPSAAPWLRPEAFFHGLIAAEVAVLLAIGPWVPAARGAGRATLEALALEALALPFQVPAAGVSQASWAASAAGALGVTGAALLVAGLQAWAPRHPAVRPVAASLLFGLMFLPPWIAFLAEAHAGGGWEGLVWISPVWGAVQGGAVAWVQAAGAALAGAALAAGAPA